METALEEVTVLSFEDGEGERGEVSYRGLLDFEENSFISVIGQRGIPPGDYIIRRAEIFQQLFLSEDGKSDLIYRFYRLTRSRLD